MTFRARDTDAGFALAESIAVLALSALVLFTLLLATDIVSRNATAAARRANDLEALATGLAAVRRDLEGALDIRNYGNAETGILFSGAPDSLGAVVGSDRTGRRNGDSLIWIETRYENGKGALVRSSAPLLPETAGFAGVHFSDSALLVEGPWVYRFAYAAETPTKLAWSGKWGDPSAMPVAIRLEVLDGAGRRVVPALTVHLNIDTPGCAGQAGECEANNDSKPGAPPGDSGDQDAPTSNR